MKIVAVFEIVPEASLTVYVAKAVPLKFKEGVNVKRPVVLTENEPFIPVKEFCTPAIVGFKSMVFVAIALSISKSFVIRFIVTEKSSFVINESLLAIGASFTEVTDIVIVATFEFKPNTSATV
jgi:hypothetical protein